jgi:hypothetical protein
MAGPHDYQEDTRCPQKDELVAFALGRLPATAREAVAGHIEACAVCLVTLQELGDQDDPLLVGLRQAVPAELFSHDHPAWPLTHRHGRAGDAPTSPDGAALVLAPTIGLSRAADVAAVLPLIPGYEIMQELGRGGVGVVYWAWQSDLKRSVALKMLLAGVYASPQESARFRTEAEAIARLHHPHIVQIHEIGEHDGRPYIALEYVDGGSLARALRGTPWPAGRAAQLLETVARAIEHAHGHGIVHRDLKPANVLLTADGSPKVSDFGVAKVVSGGGGSLTQPGEVLGTPSYTAPEQAAGKVKDVGPATDVYALGAILYELLTGRPPFAGETRLETLRLVETQEVVSPRRLQPKVPRDLETICLKCLQKEPRKRYASAAALAEDLRRWQAGEPIQARPVSRFERAWKWAKRRPAVAALTAALLLAVAVGLVLVTWKWQEEVAARQLAENRERDAEKARDEKEKARKLAEANAALAAKAAAEAQLANEMTQKRFQQLSTAQDILKSIFVDLDPRLAAKHGPPLLEQLGKRLDKAAELLEGEAVGDPLEMARLQLWLAKAQISLGYPKRAISLLLRAGKTFAILCEADHPDTLSSMNNLASAYQADGQLKKALPLFEETLAKSKLVRGADHPDTLTSMNNLALAYRADGQLKKALPLFEDTLARRTLVLGADHPDTLQSMNNLAFAYRADGQLKKALPLFEDTLAKSHVVLGADHPDTLQSMNNLASAYRADGQLKKALPLFEETLAKRKLLLGTDHPDTLQSMNNLASAYKADGQLKKALRLFEETLAKRKLVLGADHPDTLSSMNNLASAYRADGQLKKALPLFEETLAKRKLVLGADHSDTLISMDNLASAYQADGRLKKALPLFEETLAKFKLVLGADHPDTLTSMNNLALAYQADGQLKKALPLFEDTLAKRKLVLGADHANTLTSMNNLARAYQDDGQLKKALPLFEDTLAKRKLVLGADHPDTLQSMGNLAVAYRGAGRLPEAMELLEEALERARPLPGRLGWLPGTLAATYDVAGQFAKAEPLYRSFLEQARKQFGAGDLRISAAQAQLGLNLLQQKKYPEAEMKLRESLKVREQKQPDAWTTFNTKSLLGGSLLGQKKYAEAEPLLLQGYEGMKQCQAQMPKAAKARLSEAVERLVELYDAWGRPEDAARWRKELEMLKAMSL